MVQQAWQYHARPGEILTECKLSQKAGVRPVVQHEWKQARPVITRYKQDKIYKRGKTKY